MRPNHVGTPGKYSMARAIAAKSSRFTSTCWRSRASRMWRMYTSIGSDSVSRASRLTISQNRAGSTPILGSTVYSCIGCGESVPSKS